MNIHTRYNDEHIFCESDCMSYSSGAFMKKLDWITGGRANFPNLCTMTFGTQWLLQFEFDVIDHL